MVNNESESGKPAYVSKRLEAHTIPEKKEWTVMVYLAGDNNLSEEMLFALTNMFNDGSPRPEVQVTALYDSIGALVAFDIPHSQNGVTPETAAVASPIKGVVGDGVAGVASRRSVIRDHEIFIKKRHEFLLSARREQFEDVAEALANETALFLASQSVDEKPDKTLVESHAGKEKLQAIGNALSGPVGAMDKEAPPENSAALSQRLLRMSVSAAQLSPGEILEEFILDSIERHPARNYALILSGHGSGAVGDFLTSNKQFFSLSIPELSAALNNIRLSDTLQRTRKGDEPQAGNKWLSVLGFDSCLMSMAEVAYEVVDSVRYVVGAEGFQPNAGWPYDRILGLLKTPDLDAKAFATGIVDKYIAFYHDYTAADVSVDISVMDLEALPVFITALGHAPAAGDENVLPQSDEDPEYGLATLMRCWLGSLQAGHQDDLKDAIILAHWEAQGYKDEQYVDLYDFCECLRKRTDEIAKRTTAYVQRAAQRITKACDRVKTSITTLAFYKGFRGAAFQYSNGVSIFFPWADLKDAAGVSDLRHYAMLAFAEKTLWNEFLAEYLAKTIREPRRQNGNLAGKLHQSFLDYRPWLFTGEPEEPNGMRAPGATIRAPGATIRAPGATIRAPGATIRNANVTAPIRISTMKNPSIKWFEFKTDQNH